MVSCIFWLSNFDDNVDENQTKLLTIVAEGPSKILRYARVSTNPGIVDAQAIVQSEEDATFRSAYSEGFSGLTLPEFLFAIIFGTDPTGESGKFKLVDSSPNGTKIRSTKIKGVGNFKINGSVAVEFGADVVDPLSKIGVPSAPVTELSTYQSLVDHEVKETDLDELLGEDADGDIPEDYITQKEQLKQGAQRDPRTNNITAEEVIRIIGENPDLYPIDGGRLIMLLPKSLHPEINREVMLKDVLRSFAMNTQFKSRLGMIYDVVERLEFVFYESPKGDLICEFPLYDFDPDDFGTVEVPHQKFVRVSETQGNLEKNENIKRGPFASRFIVSKRDTYNFSKGITDEKVRTQITSPWHYAQNYTDVGTSKTIQKPAVVTLRHLVPLYWLRLEQVDPKGYIASNEAALLYSQILLNKFNADARNLGINAAPNLGLWLNRPIYFAPRNCIGTLMGLSHSIAWGMSGSMDSRLNLNYIRGWDGLLDDQGNIVYTPIGGQPSRPLDYKLLFKLKSDADGAVELPAQITDIDSGTG